MINMCVSMKQILEDLDISGEKYEVNKDGQIVEYKGE